MHCTREGRVPRMLRSCSLGDHENRAPGTTPMSMVLLVSGGLDSALMESLAIETGTDVWPLFIDYGQRAASQEWAACRRIHQTQGWPEPVRMDLAGYGTVIRSGLTSLDHDLCNEAFTPGRNLM